MERSTNQKLETIQDVLTERIEIANKVVVDIVDDAISDFERGFNTNEESVYKDFIFGIKNLYPLVLESAIDGTERHGIQYQAREFSHSKTGSEENKTGADFAIALGIHLPDFQLATGVYVQAKAERRNSDLGTKGLGKDSLKMLSYTSDSFVFVFPLGGDVTIIPAYCLGGIEAGGGTISNDIRETLPSKSMSEFLQEFSRGFIGDHKEVATTIHPLAWEERERVMRIVRQEFPVEQLLQIRIRPRHDELQPVDFERPL